jgi:hypothetical protein
LDEALAFDVLKGVRHIVTGGGGQVLAGIAPLVWRVCLCDQVSASPASLAERREI